LPCHIHHFNQLICTQCSLKKLNYSKQPGCKIGVALFNMANVKKDVKSSFFHTGHFEQGRTFFYSQAVFE